MIDQASLQGLTVLVTRPEGQADSLARAIVAAGGKAIKLPLLGIQPISEPAAMDVLRELVQSLDRYDLLVFISTNAARHGIEWIDRYWPQFPAGVEVMAVGPATAAELAPLGCPVQVSPSGMQSEDLLALPRLQQVRGQRIGLIRGAGGRELLAETLRARGAMVDYLEVYRRTEPAPEGDTAARIIAAGRVNAICVTSGQILDSLVHLVDIRRTGVMAMPLVVPSERIRQRALSLGFEKVFTSDGATDGAMLATLDRVAGLVREARI